MRIVRIFASLVLLFLLLVFLVGNNDRVSVNLIFHSFQEVHLSMVMIVALGLGVLIGYGVALSAVLFSKTEVRAFKYENSKLKEELNHLRNVAVDDELDSEDLN